MIIQMLECVIEDTPEEIIKKLEKSIEHIRTLTGKDKIGFTVGLMDDKPTIKILSENENGNR